MVTTVLYAHAAWCSPCVSYGPLVERLTDELGIELIHLDMDEGVDQETALQYSIRSIPTLIRDTDAEMLVGAAKEDQLREWLNG